MRAQAHKFQRWVSEQERKALSATPNASLYTPKPLCNVATEMATRQLTLTEIELGGLSQSRSPNLSEQTYQVPQKITTCGHQQYCARGLCKRCYMKAYQNDSLPDVIKIKKITICGHTPHYARGLCRKCYGKAYTQRNEVKAREKIRQNKPERKAWQKQYEREYKKRPEIKARIKIYNERSEYRESRRMHYKKEKLKALEMSGGAICINCGCNNVDFLEINHKNGGGKKEQKNGIHFIQDIYLGKRKTDDLNVLCRVCNARDYLIRKKQTEFTKGKASKHYIINKIMAFKMIGSNKCVYCGCGDIDFLEINHKNGDGGKERRATNMRTLIEPIIRGKRKTDDLEITCRVCNALDFLKRKNLQETTNFKIFWNRKTNDFNILWTDSNCMGGG
jgi:hypothetical protein